MAGMIPQPALSCPQQGQWVVVGATGSTTAGGRRGHVPVPALCELPPPGGGQRNPGRAGVHRSGQHHHRPRHEDVAQGGRHWGGSACWASPSTMHKQHSLPHSPCHTIKRVLRAPGVLSMEMREQGYGGGRVPQPLGAGRPGLAAGGRQPEEHVLLSVGVAPQGSGAIPGTPDIAPWQPVGLPLAPQDLHGSPGPRGAAPLARTPPGLQFGPPYAAALRRFPTPPPHFRRRPAPPRPWGGEAAAEAAAPARHGPARPGPAARPLPMGCGAAGHGVVRGPPSPG